ncbi:MAG: dihydroorotase [Phycisphaerae bacterium]|nr:dihydroorotase [Phycisphaerae bacterium]
MTSLLSSLLLRGGRIIDPASDTDAVGDVLVHDGKIAAISFRHGALSKHDAERTIECHDRLVVPGLIDPHVHLREPGGEAKETIRTGATSAARGGFTTVCCMPNTTPTLDTPAMIEFVRMRAREALQARVYSVGAATVGRKGEQLAPMAAMANIGAVAFSDDGDGIASAEMMRMVLSVVKSIGRAFMQHCQDATLTPGGVMNAGPLAARLGLAGWPAVAEEVMLERDCRLNRSIGARYHAQHLSSGGSAEILRRARAEGQPVSGEVAPHHLLLTDAACDGYNTNAKMNPPLRTAQDIADLKRAVADGTITVLATDHAPHTQAEKARDFSSAPFGIIGLECALGLYVKALVDDGVIDWPRLIAMMTLEPARLCGLDARPELHGIGTLSVGGIADITIIDPTSPYTVDLASFASRSRNCPFDGWPLHARATHTIVGGDVRFELPDERGMASVGSGRADARGHHG